MKLHGWMKALAAQCICLLWPTSGSTEDAEAFAESVEKHAGQSDPSHIQSKDQWLLQLGRVVTLAAKEDDSCGLGGSCGHAQADRHSSFTADHVLLQFSERREVVSHHSNAATDHSLLQLSRETVLRHGDEHGAERSDVDGWVASGAAHDDGNLASKNASEDLGMPLFQIDVSEESLQRADPESCEKSQISRRRRGGSCFCRRRHSGPSDLPSGRVCQGDRIIRLPPVEPTPQPTIAAPTPSPTETCGFAVSRRRRNADMCSCRRRSGGFDLQKGFICQGDSIASCGDDCPMGWHPGDTIKAAGAWCQVNVPKAAWKLKSCPSNGLSTRVRVLSYNLFWWHLFGRNHGKHNGVERSAGKLIARTAQKEPYDVMGFQECDDKGRILGDAITEGLPAEYEILDGGKALAIAYRSSVWRLLEGGTQDVGEDSPREYYGRRAVQWVRLQHLTDRNTLFFVNHHGPLPVSARGGCTGSATAYNILKLIASTARSADAIILVGDFNAQNIPNTRIDVLRRYMHLLFSGVAMGGVDHIFSNCRASTIYDARNLGSGGSDHDAISAVISI